MKVDVLNIEGKKVKTVELAPAIFEAPINVDLMHQAFLRQMANARLGTSDTKTRNEVAGGGRKPWRQKGTGRARQGSIRAAQWKGGGRIHTPHPRSYAQAMRFNSCCAVERRWPHPYSPSTFVRSGNAAKNATCRSAFRTVRKSIRECNRDY